MVNFTLTETAGEEYEPCPETQYLALPDVHRAAALLVEFDEAAAGIRSRRPFDPDGRWQWATIGKEFLESLKR